MFDINRFPNVDDRFHLEKMTGLPSRVIQVWFQNRRREQKYKNKMSESASGNKPQNIT